MSRVGRYEILSRIGAGGMGEVYRARDSKLGRDVAIKVLPEAFARDRERMARFEREAKFLAALNHPNIAAIYGVEDAGPTDALVMELAEGPTLADRIAAGPVPLAEALPIARQIADALEYAHEHGVVHRDLKPANIKVSHDGCVKVLDFGLAKAVEGEADAANISNSPTISQMATEAGVLLGTVAYMSPEQVKAKPVDRRADIWAFGCVLYEMLTGKKVFAADTLPETLAAILTKEPDWSQLSSGTPLRVRVLLQRCLQKDPKQRLRDIGDARISLDEVLSGASEPVPEPAVAPPLRRRALPWALLGVTALALAVAVIALLHFREKPPAPADSVVFHVSLPEKSIYLFWITLSPDGRHLAFVTLNQDGQQQLWVQDLNSPEPRLLPNIDHPSEPFWSPDSRSLAFQNRSKLERVDISGGAPQTICAIDRQMFGGTWNPDGVILFGSFKGLMKVSPTGGQPSMLIKKPHSLGVFLGYPGFLADERHFVYIATPTAHGNAGYIGSLDAGGKEQPLKPLVDNIISGLLPASGSGSESILFIDSENRLVAQPFDASRMELKGDPSPVAEGVHWFTVSANGVLAYAGGNNPPLQLTWFNRQGRVLGTVGEPGVFPTPAISPDGRVVAVPVFDRSGKSDIWLYDLARGAPTRFTHDGRVNQYPVWSPDGSRIAFFWGTSPGGQTVYQRPVNGVGKEEPLKAAAPDDLLFPLDWSPDGRYLIELGLRDGSIWMTPLSPDQKGGESKSISWLNEGAGLSRARFSPDGKFIAFAGFDESGRDEIYVRTFLNPGDGWQVSTNGGTHPVWSRDGKELYYIALDGNLMAAGVKRLPDGIFDHGAPKVLFNPHIGPLDRPWSFDVTKDGRFLIPVLIQQQSLAPITVVLNWHAPASK